MGNCLDNCFKAKDSQQNKEKQPILQEQTITQSRRISQIAKVEFEKNLQGPVIMNSNQSLNLLLSQLPQSNKMQSPEQKENQTGALSISDFSQMNTATKDTSFNNNNPVELEDTMSFSFKKEKGQKQNLDKYLSSDKVHKQSFGRKSPCQVSQFKLSDIQIEGTENQIKENQIQQEEQQESIKIVSIQDNMNKQSWEILSEKDIKNIKMLKKQTKNKNQKHKYQQHFDEFEDYSTEAESITNSNPQDNQLVSSNLNSNLQQQPQQQQNQSPFKRSEKKSFTYNNQGQNLIQNKLYKRRASVQEFSQEQLEQIGQNQQVEENWKVVVDYKFP